MPDAKPIMLYAAILAVVFVALTLRTIVLRTRVRVALGDGGDARLQRAIRAHANFVEYTPFALLLLVLLTWGGADSRLLHTLGTMLIAGRIIHAVGISQVKEPLPLRQVGMVLTLSVLLVSAGVLMYLVWVKG
ncbi:MAPEG family protein [Chitinimonas sp. BJYL2]|uniref:MAPEG family protein n=1 Tax=Chitinimonas sp. BJYL2 TaxID=2976696 RepID=UPI0022B3A82A|nr:MAPEG family protein [Chitinimonas sp. BJYL2]